MNVSMQADNINTRPAEANSNLALAVADLEFSYPGQTVLLNVKRLEIQDKEIVSILGPSGCGKTTFMLLIAGLFTPSAGTISVFGKTPVQIRETGAMAVVFQNATLLPWRTVIGNLTLPFDLRGIPVDE